MRRPTATVFRALIDLAFPLAAVQVGLMAMGLVDSAMVGRVSAEALGGVAIANIWFFVVSTIGMGCMYALDPVIAQAKGAGDEAGIALGLQRGLLIAALISLPTTLALAQGERILAAAGQTAGMVPLAGQYIEWLLTGMFPYFGFLAFRQTLQALGVVRPVLIVILAANLLNVGINWIFIFGHWGAPALGVRGAALATTISRWAMFVGLAAITWPVLRRYLRPWRPETARLEPLRRMLAIGIPLGLQILAEYGVFGLVGLLLGRIGTEAVAGHQIALNYAAITFMVPLGIGAAAAALVGQAVGAGEVDRARRIAGAALTTGAVFMTVTAGVLVLIPDWLAGL
jgi:MATE family multidrug resistance protein